MQCMCLIKLNSFNFMLSKTITSTVKKLLEGNVNCQPMHHLTRVSAALINAYFKCIWVRGAHELFLDKKTGERKIKL